MIQITNGVIVLLDKRVVYSPFEYPTAFDYWTRQQQAHWLHTEVSLASDINDWKIKLSQAEKNVIGNILKGFTQTEVFIGDYWSTKVTKWFKKPEIQMMANTFAAFESIHAVSYAYLNESLGLEDFEAFLHEKTAKAKIDRLIEMPGKSKEDMAKSLAVFSGFNEGVNLFSSFAVLMSFSQRNLLKGVGQIIAFSIRDESLHSEAGCWLFRTLLKEYPELWTDELKKEIYEAARLTVELEDNFIDKAFELGPLPGLDPKDLKTYIRARTNTKLGDLGLKNNWKNLDKTSLEKMNWFDYLSVGTESTDFFAGRVTEYSKGSVNWDLIYSDAALNTDLNTK